MNSEQRIVDNKVSLLVFHSSLLAFSFSLHYIFFQHRIGRYNDDTKVTRTRKSGS